MSRLALIAKLSLEHGVYLEGLRTVLPSRTLSEVERHAVAEKNVNLMSGSTYSRPSWQRKAIKYLREANRRCAAIEAARADIAAKVLETTRSAALVELLRRGLDADPVFAEIAAATDSWEIRAFLCRREAPTGVQGWIIRALE